METNLSTWLEKRIALVSRELQKSNIDIATLRKTRSADEERLKEEHGKFPFFWKGFALQERRIYGVGIAIKNPILPKITDVFIGINERLTTLCLQFPNEQYGCRKFQDRNLLIFSQTNSDFDK